MNRCLQVLVVTPRGKSLTQRLDSAANLTNPDGIDFRFGYDFIKATTQGTEC